MRSPATAFTFVLVLCLCACRTTPQAPSTPLENDLLPFVLADQQGMLTARMPAEPQVERESIETAHGALDSVTYSSEVSDVLFVVTVNLFPEGALDPASSLGSLEAARDASLGSTGGEITQERVTEVDGLTALEMTVLVEGGAYRTRMIVAGTRMYQILVASTKEEDVHTERASAFLDSVRIGGGGEV
ncbi:MAG: hypothetical protein ACOC0J_01230 [Myxococcota bacterium]